MYTCTVSTNYIHAILHDTVDIVECPIYKISLSLKRRGNLKTEAKAAIRNLKTEAKAAIRNLKTEAKAAIINLKQKQKQL